MADSSSVSSCFLARCLCLPSDDWHLMLLILLVLPMLMLLVVLPMLLLLLFLPLLRQLLCCWCHADAVRVLRAAAS
jgi:hypothetical protein